MKRSLISFTEDKKKTHQRRDTEDKAHCYKIKTLVVTLDGTDHLFMGK